MKLLMLLFALLACSLQFVMAGGSSSLIKLHKVKSIKIEEDKITVVGDGMVRKRVFSDKEHEDTTVFGQSAQTQVTKVSDCTFEIVPYGTRDDIAGVPGGGPITPERKKRNELHFANLVARAKTINVGDEMSISYQRDRTTLLGYKITHIVGAGSLRKVPKVAKEE